MYAPILISIALILLLVAGQKLTTRAARRLSAEEKALVFDASTKGQAGFFLTLVLLFFVDAILSDHFGPNRWRLLAFLVLIAAVALVFSALAIRRVSRLRVSADYVHAFRRSVSLTIGGALLLLVMMNYRSFTLLEPIPDSDAEHAMERILKRSDDYREALDAARKREDSNEKRDADSR